MIHHENMALTDGRIVGSKLGSFVKEQKLDPVDEFKTMSTLHLPDVCT